MNEFVSTNPALVMGLISLLMTILGFLMGLTLIRINRNMADLYNKYNDQNGRLSRLEGEHNARVRGGIPCVPDGG